MYQLREDGQNGRDGQGVLEIAVLWVDSLVEEAVQILLQVVGDHLVRGGDKLQETAQCPNVQANQVCDSFLFKLCLGGFLTPQVGGSLVGLVHLWTDQRITGPVSCCRLCGSLESRPAGT